MSFNKKSVFPPQGALSSASDRSPLTPRGDCRGSAAPGPEAEGPWRRQAWGSEERCFPNSDSKLGRTIPVYQAILEK